MRKVIVLLATLLLLCGCSVPAEKERKEIDLNPYLSIEVQGYDEEGVAAWAIDEKALKKEIGTEDSLSGLISVEVEPKENLKNGDIVHVKWKVDENTLKKKYSVKAVYNDFEYEIGKTTPLDYCNRSCRYEQFKKEVSFSYEVPMYWELREKEGVQNSDGSVTLSLYEKEKAGELHIAENGEPEAVPEGLEQREIVLKDPEFSETLRTVNAGVNTEGLYEFFTYTKDSVVYTFRFDPGLEERKLLWTICEKDYVLKRETEAGQITYEISDHLPLDEGNTDVEFFVNREDINTPEKTFPKGMVSISIQSNGLITVSYGESGTGLYFGFWQKEAGNRISFFGTEDPYELPHDDSPLCPAILCDKTVDGYLEYLSGDRLQLYDADGNPVSNAEFVRK
ncbi:MAG: hypothetical protein IKE59_06965 [Erysipelotrichaceae bacterium]|nr:hypothetical protein [Erysipelotrichaceae bacterium]